MSASTPISASCSATRKRYPPLVMTIGRPNSAGSETRCMVAWNVECGPNSGRNCLGRPSRDAGHSRVPAPPHMISGRIGSGMGWVSAATFDDSANAWRVPRLGVRRLRDVELHFVDLVIAATPGNQLVVPPGLDHAAFLDHADPIGGDDGLQPVRVRARARARRAPAPPAPAPAPARRSRWWCARRAACRARAGSRARLRCRAPRSARRVAGWGAFFRKARAMAMRARWPPESCNPCSPTCAS